MLVVPLSSVLLEMYPRRAEFMASAETEVRLNVLKVSQIAFSTFTVTLFGMSLEEAI